MKHKGEDMLEITPTHTYRPLIQRAETELRDYSRLSEVLISRDEYLSSPLLASLTSPSAPRVLFPGEATGLISAPLTVLHFSSSSLLTFQFQLFLPSNKSPLRPSLTSAFSVCVQAHAGKP